MPLRRRLAGGGVCASCSVGSDGETGSGKRVDCEGISSSSVEGEAEKVTGVTFGTKEKVRGSEEAPELAAAA